jgi:hypothetical protein
LLVIERRQAHGIPARIQRTVPHCSEQVWPGFVRQLAPAQKTKKNLMQNVLSHASVRQKAGGVRQQRRPMPLVEVLYFLKCELSSHEPQTILHCLHYIHT